MTALYDSISKNYALGRCADPRIAARIHYWLEDAAIVLNIGAGSAGTGLFLKCIAWMPDTES